MNVENLFQASDTLGWMAEHFSKLPESENGAVANGLACVMARMIVVELAKHLADGIEPYDAFVETAKGMLPVS